MGQEALVAGSNGRYAFALRVVDGVCRIKWRRAVHIRPVLIRDTDNGRLVVETKNEAKCHGSIDVSSDCKLRDSFAADPRQCGA